MKSIQSAIICTFVIIVAASIKVEAETNILIKPPVIAADKTVKLNWNAQTGAVYQIEAADSLTTPGSQGFQWIIRETDCVSKGTNAEWMDVGTAQWIPRILHPRFQPMRFYRVQKVKQATLASPVVSLQLSQSNLINGDLYATVNVSFADTNQQMSSVGVFVDGQRLYSVPSESFAVFINSCEWPNGPHEIYAIATTVDSGETLPGNGEAETNAANFAVGISSSYSVTFSNYISQFFVAVPFFIPASGQTQEVVATFPEDTCWRLTVLDYQNTPVRLFTNQSSSLYVAWDGNDGSGNSLPYGYYDYFIEARPSRFGCLDSFAANAYMNNSFAGAIDLVSKPAPIQFSTEPSNNIEDIDTPSLNSRSLVETNSTTPHWPENWTITYDGTNKLINGVPAILYPPIFESGIPISSGRTRNGASESIGNLQADDWGDGVYTTQTPNRSPGNLFKGYAGTVGIGFQGHHPGGSGWALPPGGVISPSSPPYGSLVNASTIAIGFSSDMVLYGWRTSFYLGNDNLNYTNLFPEAGTYSGQSTFASRCDFGLLVGHMTATANIDPNYSCTHSYYPFYNSKQPGAYQWGALPGMDFGYYWGGSPLKWMALYGCNSLRYEDMNDMWTKFRLPMPPNIRLLLGSEEGVFIHPSFGGRFALDLNNSMTIVDAWCDAAHYADLQTSKSLRFRFTMGTRHMSYVYRDITQEGSWRTSNDSIWNWGGDISLDWFDVSYTTRQVYP